MVEMADYILMEMVTASTDDRPEVPAKASADDGTKRFQQNNRNKKVD